MSQPPLIEFNLISALEELEATGPPAGLCSASLGAVITFPSAGLGGLFLLPTMQITAVAMRTPGCPLWISDTCTGWAQGPGSHPDPCRRDQTESPPSRVRRAGRTGVIGAGDQKLHRSSTLNGPLAAKTTHVHRFPRKHCQGLEKHPKYILEPPEENCTVGNVGCGGQHTTPQAERTYGRNAQLKAEELCELTVTA